MVQRRIVSKTQQTGVTTVEFAIIGFVLFLTIFALIETGRLLWVWESLAEATRRGARVAAVCPVNHSAIANVTVFNDPNSSGASAIIDGLSTGQVTVSYLNQGGAPEINWCDIEYVRVQITGYVHNFVVPIVGSFLNAPDFVTTLPIESLGLVPGVGFECFGVASATPSCT